MDSLIIWKSVILFLSIYFLSWIILYTFQPSDILGWDNAIGLNNKQRQDLFYYSLVPSSICIVLYLFYTLKIKRKSVKIECSKEAKSLGQCKINRN